MDCNVMRQPVFVARLFFILCCTCLLLGGTAGRGYCDWYVLVAGEYDSNKETATVAGQLSERGYETFMSSSGQVIVGFFPEREQAELAAERSFPAVSEGVRIAKFSPNRAAGMQFWTPPLPNSLFDSRQQRYKAMKFPIAKSADGSRLILVTRGELTPVQTVMAQNQSGVMAGKNKMSDGPKTVGQNDSVNQMDTSGMLPADAMAALTGAEFNQPPPARMTAEQKDAQSMAEMQQKVRAEETPVKQWNTIPKKISQVRTTAVVDADAHKSVKVPDSAPLLGYARSSKPNYLGGFMGYGFHSGSEAKFPAEDSGLDFGVSLRRDLDDYFTIGGTFSLANRVGKKSISSADVTATLDNVKVREWSAAAEIMYNFFSDRQQRAYMMGSAGFSYFEMSGDAVLTAGRFDLDGYKTPVVGTGLGWQYTVDDKTGLTVGAELRYKYYTTQSSGGPSYEILPVVTAGYRF
ncbi:MAG: hypothetical protein ACNI27_14690 [Desulfovibrio sp.]